MNKPKCLITGSAQGLGLAIKKRFEQTHDIIEYDLKYGQDLNQQSVRDQLILDLNDCEVFFNNAHGSFQEELTERAFNLQNKLAIIVSNSTVTYYKDNAESIKNYPGWKDYIKYKKKLTAKIESLHNRQAQGKDRCAWIINLKLNYLDTAQHRELEESKLDIEHVVDIVKILVQ